MGLKLFKEEQKGIEKRTESIGINKPVSQRCTEMFFNI